jgi:hypothetical protein
MELGALGMTGPRAGCSRRFARSAAARSTQAIADPRAARRGHPARRDRLQAADAHRRVVPDAHQAQRRARHRRIEAVTKAGVRLEGGSERPADVLVLATGFQDPRLRRADGDRRQGGRTLAEEWDGVPRAYLGMSVPGFPNMFLLYGPNTNGGTVELGLATFADLASGARTCQPAQRMRELIEEVELADQLGLDVFAIGEHHRPDFLVSSPAVVLGGAAVKTERIRLSSAVTVLSSDDPVRVFQEFAEVDLLSAGARRSWPGAARSSSRSRCSATTSTTTTSCTPRSSSCC